MGRACGVYMYVCMYVCRWGDAHVRMCTMLLHVQRVCVYVCVRARVCVFHADPSAVKSYPPVSRRW